MSPDGSLRVLLLTHVFPRDEEDAAAPFVLRYAAALRNAGLAVRVLAPHDAGLPPEHVVSGIPVRRIRYADDAAENLAYRGEMHLRARTASGARKALALALAMRRAVREEVHGFAPDVLDVHWLVPGGIVSWLSGVRVPTEVVVHGTDVALVDAGRVRRFVARRAAAAPDLLAAASGSLSDDCARVLGRRADAIVTMPPRPPPADVPPPPGKDRLLAVGRLVPEKGHADLVEAVARLRHYDYDASLTIVGDGPEAGRLTELARRRHVPIDMPGALAPRDLERAYADADVVAIPSHREGFGLVAVEALARRRPVVATRAGGLREIVTTETGWPVPAGDTFAFASALATVFDEPEEAGRRAEAGARAVAGRWGADAVGAAAVERFTHLARGG